MSIKKKHRCALSLIAALMLATLSVTGCGANVNANLNKTEEPSEASESGSDDETEDRSENEAPDTAITADTEAHTVHLNSKATRGAGYISVNETFTDQKGNQYNLFMNGLKEENKDAMLHALSLYYDADSEDGLTIYDDAFADAEKYDDYANSDTVVSYAEMDPELDNDSAQCWASAAADALWVTGWAEKLQNPITGNAFSSEDDVFRYYNRKITNDGSESSAAVDFLFMGELYVDPAGSNHMADILNDPSPEDGLMKSFFSSNMTTQYDLIEEPDNIEALKHCGDQGSDASDFTLDLSDIVPDEELSSSVHAVSAIGVITDPNAANTKESMKAILIVDPDNDAQPSEADGIGENPTLEEKDAAKEARPNSVTVYNLQYTKDPNDVPYWLMKGYASSETGLGAAIYGVTEIPHYSEDIIAANTETEGTKSAYDSVDLSLETLFTTSESEAMDVIIRDELKEVTVNDFSSGDPVNLNFHIANRGNVVLNEDYLNGKDLVVDWSVVRDDDGSVVAKDRLVTDEPVFERTVTAYLITLNQDGDKVVSWEPGDYTVILDINADRSVPEAYYLNNVPKEYHFTIK